METEGKVISGSLTVITVALIIVVFLVSWATQGKVSLVIATSDEYAPFGFRDSAGDLGGFDYVYGQELCKEMRVSCEWRVLPFDTIISAVSSGEVDLAVASFTRTTEREKFVDFSLPYYHSFGQFVRKTQSGQEPEAVMEDGVTIAVQRGTIYEQYLTSPAAPVNDIKLVLTDMQEEAFQKVSSGEADFTVADDVLVDLAVSSSPFFGDGNLGSFTRHGPPIHPQPGSPEFAVLGSGEIGIIVGREEPELLERINRAITVVGQRPSIIELSREYFGRSITGIQ